MHSRFLYSFAAPVVVACLGEAWFSPMCKVELALVQPAGAYGNQSQRQTTLGTRVFPYLILLTHAPKYC